MCNPLAIGMAVAGAAMTYAGSRKQAKAQTAAGKRTADAISAQNKKTAEGQKGLQANIMDTLQLFNPDAREATRKEEEERIGSQILGNIESVRDDAVLNKKMSGRILSNDRYLGEQARQQSEMTANMIKLAKLTGKTQATSPALQLLGIKYGGKGVERGTLAAEMLRQGQLGQNKINAAGMVDPTPGAAFMKGVGNSLMAAGASYGASSLMAPTATPTVGQTMNAADAARLQTSFPSNAINFKYSAMPAKQLNTILGRGQDFTKTFGTAF